MSVSSIHSSATLMRCSLFSICSSNSWMLSLIPSGVGVRSMVSMLLPLLFGNARSPAGDSRWGSHLLTADGGALPADQDCWTATLAHCGSRGVALRGVLAGFWTGLVSVVSTLWRPPLLYRQSL